MTSVRTTNLNHVDAHGSAARDCSARLSLKPSSSARGAVDGAWWPRSTDPALELTALIEAVGAHRAPVRRDHTEQDWMGQRSCRIRLASGRKVAVGWVRSDDIHPARILGTDDQRIDPLVISVDATLPITRS
jgi:uncharacterized protein DUF5994